MPNTNIDTDALESLRAFALAHGELQFAHLSTAAINGEEWANGRVAEALDEMPLWANNMQHELTLLHIIRATDTTRPDGLIPRSFTP